MMKTTSGYLWSKKMLETQAPLGFSLVRIILGWIFLKEGTGKLFAWLGGGGFESAGAYFEELGIPFARANAFLVGSIEFLGGICLVLGFLVRPVAFFIGTIMAVAIFTAHRTGGYHYPMLILAVCIAFLQMGAGRLSLGRLMSSKKQPASKKA